MTKQEEAVAKLSRIKVGALFMEMGTGKTKVALDLIASKAGKVDYVLWVCPFSIKGEIETERKKWHPELDIDIVGCESIGSSDRVYLEVSTKVKSHSAFVVVDESLKIKNKEAKRTKRLLTIGESAKYKLILNGTPLSKNVLDLWTQMQFLSPKILDMSYNQFKNTYCEYYVRGRLKDLVKKQHNIPHLIAKIMPYVFDSELSLNKGKAYYDYPYTLEDCEGYRELKHKLIRNEIEFNFMAVAQSLQHFYCNSKSKQAIIEEIISASNEQFVVFVKFLQSIPSGADRLVGDETARERKQTIERFKSGASKVLYITYGCGAFGLNLQNCHNVIFAEHTFDYAQRIQAEARVFRIGQAQDVHYFNIWCKVGLENMIQASLAKKSNLLAEAKKEIQKQGLEEWAKHI